MHWPWEKQQEIAKIENETVTDPAREEIHKSQDRINRINRILREARAAEKLVVRTHRR